MWESILVGFVGFYSIIAVSLIVTIAVSGD